MMSVGQELAPFVGGSANGSAWCSTTTDIGGNVTIKPYDVIDGLVPDVRGMGLSDAIFLLESYGMRVTHEGIGRIVEQSIEPGQTIEESKCDIHLKLEV